MWWSAFSIAESAEVNVQLSKSANESAPMHSQFSGGFALIPMGGSEDGKNELLSKFLQCFGISKGHFRFSAQRGKRVHCLRFDHPWFNPLQVRLKLEKNAPQRGITARPHLGG